MMSNVFTEDQESQLQISALFRISSHSKQAYFENLKFETNGHNFYIQNLILFILFVASSGVYV